MVPWLERRRRLGDRTGLMHWMETERSANACFDALLEAGYLWAGDPDTVCTAIEDYYRASGGFGMLLVFAAQGYVTPDQWERSLRLIADQVAPRVRQLDPGQPTTA
jgi:alkanesulfonate monooxygenase SsuD/methylene tetrahydromethanopterin reductase-like flavin-dependent oxidoreductase (luciferase family)